MNNFVFHGEWVTAIRRLPNDVRLELYDAIVQYAITGKEPILKPMARIAYDFVQPTLDIDRKKYEAMCVRNKENRTKSCRELLPIVTSGNERSQVGSNNSNNNNNNNNITKEESIKEEPPKGCKKKDELSSYTHTPLENLEKRKKNFYESLRQYVQQYGKEMVRAFFDYWTEPNKSKTKMRFELERTWDTQRRLATWAARDNCTFKQQESKQITNIECTSTTRQAQTEELLKELDENKKNAVSRDAVMQSEEYRRALQES